MGIYKTLPGPKPPDRECRNTGPNRPLTVSGANAYEAAAEQIAGKVMRTPVEEEPGKGFTGLQIRPAAHRYAGTAATQPPGAQQILNNSTGKPLEKSLQSNRPAQCGNPIHSAVGTGMVSPFLLVHNHVPIIIQREEASAPVVRHQNATPEVRREYGRTVIWFLRNQLEHFTRFSSDNPGENLRHLRTTAENGLAQTETEPTAEAVVRELRTVYRDAVRQLLLWRINHAANRIGDTPTLQQLYEEHRDDILPFALPQTQAEPGASELSAELSAPLPDNPSTNERRRYQALRAARQRLRVLTSSVEIDDIHDLFSTGTATTHISLPPNTTVRHAGNVPAALRNGLQNVAGRLMESELTPDTTIMLALDLTPYGGSYASYRFTRLNLGRIGTEVLVERQGTIGIEGLRTEQRQQLQERFDQAGFRRESGFNQEEFDQVLIGFSQIPRARLTGLGGLRFRRRAADPDNPDAAGQYEPLEHRISLFDRAFSGGMMRLGTGSQPLTYAAHSVVHEIGHAVDLSPLRTTAAATETARTALLNEFGTGNGGRYEIPARNDPERARFDTLRQALRSAEAAEQSARALSGARWTRGSTANITDARVRGVRNPAFRQAAIRDGGTAGTVIPTNYPNPESFWQEYFAESYALFRTSPDQLQRMRPNVFNFMRDQLPE